MMSLMPAHSNDITQKRFGDLTALCIVGKSGRENVWLCECKCGCGRQVHIRLSNLTSGNTKSCGGLKKKLTASPM